MIGQFSPRTRRYFAAIYHDDDDEATRTRCNFNGSSYGITNAPRSRFSVLFRVMNLRRSPLMTLFCVLFSLAALMDSGGETGKCEIDLALLDLCLIIWLIGERMPDEFKALGN